MDNTVRHVVPCRVRNISTGARGIDDGLDGLLLDVFFGDDIDDDVVGNESITGERGRGGEGGARVAQTEARLPVEG